MFIFAFFIGIYSYSIFLLGILSILTKTNCLIVTIIWFVLLLFFERKFLVLEFKKLRAKTFAFTFYKNPVSIFVGLFILLALVNLIGALGPELAFDALWYHLTLPKLFLLHHAIYHIPGGLIYYSDMPKIGEMLYVGSLALGNDITAKLIHYFFGIICAVVLYKFSRTFFTSFVSILVVCIFYANLVVDTESIAAYIDLIRTFFEILALWSFIEWVQKQRVKWFFFSALMLGLTITTKVLAIGSLIIFSLLFLIIYFDSRFSMRLDISRFHIKNRFGSLLIFLLLYWFIALVVPLPWFIFSYIHTGNPVYPFFTHTYEVNTTHFGVIQFFGGLWNLFMYSSDPISPLYLIFLPLLFVFYPKLQKEIQVVVWYSGLSLIIWYFTPQTGGGRFILPYLPAFSLICGALYSQILKKIRIEWKYVSHVLFVSMLFVFIISIGYRFVANSKYIPVLLGKESESQFLTNHLNFSYGDFYDTDGYFAKHIKPTDTVLLYGFHNLYYVDFPFVDNSWVKKGYKFNYIAMQNMKLPPKFKDWQLIYNNDKTMVQLYRPPKGECRTTCVY